jgi:hypothetical protein
LNATPLKSDKNVIQLDRTQVKVIGELKYVMIRISTYPKFFQVTDIIIVDIPEAYGMFLSEDWSEKLNGYFSNDWDHLWFPLKGHPNMIMIDRERCIERTVTDLDTPNEPLSTYFPVLHNYSCDSYFGNLSPYQSDIPSKKKSKIIFQIDLLVASEESMTHQEFPTKVVAQEVEIEETTSHVEIGNPSLLMWIMYFDGSK